MSKEKRSFLFLAAVFLVGAVFSSFSALKTSAASETLGDLTLEYPGTAPLFYALNIVPGYEEVKTITIINSGTVPHTFSMALSSSGGILGDVLEFEPRNFESKAPYWNHTINQIAASPSGFPILDIAAGQTVKIDLAAILPESVGNEYQGLTISTFDIIFGADPGGQTYKDNPPIVLPIGPTDEPKNEQTNESTSEPTGGIATGGASGLLSTTAIPRFATIAGTGASGAAGGAPVVEQPKVESAQAAGKTAALKGEETVNKIYCFWWWLLLIVLTAFLIIFGALTYDKEVIFAWVWPVLAGVAAFVIHIIMHRWYTPVKWCDYFIWFELGELIIYFIFFSYLRNRALNKEEK